MKLWNIKHPKIYPDPHFETSQTLNQNNKGEELCDCANIHMKWIDGELHISNTSLSPNSYYRKALRVFIPSIYQNTNK